MNQAFQKTPSFSKRPSKELKTYIEQQFEQARRDHVLDHAMIRYTMMEIIQLIEAPSNKAKDSKEFAHKVSEAIMSVRDVFSVFFVDERTIDSMNQIRDRVKRYILANGL